MQNNLKKCPRCGSSLIKYTNKNTNRYFTKCSNKECHFSLRDNYYDEEISLQGIELQSKCLGCGQPLEIACGPLGLYARCYHCNYDSTPHSVDGELAIRWANAHSQQAKDEINDLIIQFKKKSEAQIGFEEEDYVAQTDFSSEVEANFSKELKEVGITNKLSEDAQVILNFLSKNINNPYSSIDIFKNLKDYFNSSCAVINCLKTLREEKLVKIVGYNDNFSSVKIFYQVQESPLKETKVYLEDKGYSSISKFFKNTDLYSTTMRTKIARKLRSLKEPTFLVQHDRGFYMGYKIKSFEKVIDLLNNESNTKEITEVKQLKLIDTEESNKSSREVKRDIRRKILEILRKDINNGYTSSQIGKILNLKRQSVSDSLRVLKDKGIVKIVGLEPLVTSGNYSYIVQVVESPLKPITMESTKECVTLRDFYNNNKDKLRVKTYSSLLNVVRENSLKEYLVVQSNRPFLGYKEKELEKLLLPMKKRTVKTVTVEANVNEVKEESKSTLFSSMFKMFHKPKEKSTDIVYF